MIKRIKIIYTSHAREIIAQHLEFLVVRGVAAGRGRQAGGRGTVGAVGAGRGEGGGGCVGGVEVEGVHYEAVLLVELEVAREVVDVDLWIRECVCVGVG